jgi:Spy/CpxP family protein refolding chaperone
MNGCRSRYLLAALVPALVLGAGSAPARAAADYPPSANSGSATVPWGPGMMDGYGMGPGMMGGYGMGPGMMGGYGMGPGMAGRIGRVVPDLTADQKSKISQVQRDARAKHWALMGRMIEAQDRLQDLYDADKPDSAAIHAQYREIEALRRQMADIALDANEQIDAVLGKEQRERLHAWRRAGVPWGE